jgi:hypothetical protein
MEDEYPKQCYICRIKSISDSECAITDKWNGPVPFWCRYYVSLDNRTYRDV